MMTNLSKFFKYTYTLCLIFIILYAGLQLNAQSSLIEVEARVDKSVITIGDRITYTLKVNRVKDLQIQDPGPGANLGMFEIKDYEVHQPAEKNGRIIEQFDYVISVYDTGRFVIPPFPIVFSPSDTTTEKQYITSEALEIRVESLVNAEDAEIKDVKPPFSIPVEKWRLALITGGIVLLMVVAGLLYWYYRKRKEGEPIFRKEVIRPAHEIAFEELDRLLNSDLLKEEKYKSFYTRLSEIFRRYVEMRFYIQALEETTTELLSSLEEAGISKENLDLAREALSKCDLVKFASFVPDPVGTEETVRLTRAFIERTRLEFEVVERLEEMPGNDKPVRETSKQ